MSRTPQNKPDNDEVVKDITVLHIGDQRSNEICGVTVRDRVLFDLSEMIVKGWPIKRYNMPEN